MTEANPTDIRHFWTHTPDALCELLRCSHDGLSTEVAEARLGQFGPNADAVAKRASLFGFETPPFGMLGGVGFLVVVYLVSAELFKRVALAPSAMVVAPRFERSGRA